LRRSYEVEVFLERVIARHDSAEAKIMRLPRRPDLSGLLAMTLPLVVARLMKSAEAISVGAGDCHAMTERKDAGDGKNEVGNSG